jgi:hypothetical protein
MTHWIQSYTDEGETSRHEHMREFWQRWIVLSRQSSVYTFSIHPQMKLAVQVGIVMNTAKDNGDLLVLERTRSSA